MQLTADFQPDFTARNAFLHGGRTVLPLNAQIGNRTKACALAGYDCPKTDGLAKKDKLPNKMQKRQIDTMPVHHHVLPASTDDLFTYHRRL